MAGTPLSQGFGYGIVLGLGFAFAFGMILTTFLLKRYNNEVQTSEMFSTAGRTVKTGLVASAVVSSWTWAATLLQSSGVAYRYGISGPFWYASGATVQIILFATLAIELKRKAPNAHTFLEVIRARYGVYGHITFIIFGLMTNVLVTAMLLTGGSAVVTSLTGTFRITACASNLTFLKESIPLLRAFFYPWASVGSALRHAPFIWLTLSQFFTLFSEASKRPS